ncbi:major facilitator superfamily domain-containing protein [Phyllosticta citriasiana]|uniref:Major facilitator superfamily domain-containing protein n=1 Tax=Phyllosticta citriasiana TaxID=595635 RepID=A0ABR1KQ17_9PEZI
MDSHRRELPGLDKTDTVREVTQQHSSSNTSQDDHIHTHVDSHQHQDLGRTQSHGSHAVYRVYRRRWFGLAQLVLLNIVISWDWLSFSAVSTDAAEFFGVSESVINWLSTAFLFAFLAAVPVTIPILHRGPKPAILVASALTLVGSWIRYAGARATGGNYGAIMVAQIMIGLAQPFVLAAPTRYSDLWFTEQGRISATAVASLANPLGAALGQLVNSMWVSKPRDVPDMVLYTAILSSAAALPSFFIPAAPPSPASASSSFPQTTLAESLRLISRSRSFYLVLAPFAVYVGFFNAFSSLLNQILYPYGFSETDAGVCGALLIFVGLLFSALLSPFLDRRHPKPYILVIKILCPIVVVCYIAFVFAPPTRSEAAPYVIAALLGASSFALVPIALEYLVETTWPASPEIGSTLCWAGGQLLGGIFIVIMDALKEPGCLNTDDCQQKGKTSRGWKPPGSLWKALIFEAVVAVAVLPAPLLLGVKRLGFGESRKEGRIEADEVEREGLRVASTHGDVVDNA